MPPKKPKKPDPAEPAFRTVRVPITAYNRAHALLDVVAPGGWAMVGANRGDRPTLGTLIDEGLSLLGNQLNKGKKP